MGETGHPLGTGSGMGPFPFASPGRMPTPSSRWEALRYLIPDNRVLPLLISCVKLPSQCSKTLRLITRADDAGSARSANEAIEETVRHGIIRNVSVMAAGVELEHAADLLRNLPGICFGLHATLNAEWTTVRWRPVLSASQVPSLVDREGAFTAHPGFLHEHGFELSEVAAEMRAQLTRLRSVGFKPSYIDTHMGFHWLPGVEAVLAEIAKEEGLLFDASLKHPCLPVGRAGIRAAIDGTSGGPWLLITHPGKNTVEMRAFANADVPAGVIAEERDAERRVLCAPQLLTRVKEGSLILETYQ